MCNCIGELGQACKECHTPIKENWPKNWLYKFLKEEYSKDWKCPINYPGCRRNCGNYGCGN